MTQPSATCKNCGSTLTGKFCQNCGQSAAIHKITISNILHEFFHALTHADRGFLFLVKELITRPGYVVQDYLEGKRKKYFNPLSFLVISSAIWALIVLKSGYFESMNSGYSKGSYRMPEEFARYFAESMKIIIAHGKIISLVISVPVLSFLTWIFFRKNKNTYAENLVLQSFMLGQSHLALVLIFVPAFWIFGYAKMNNNIFQFVFLCYLIVAYQQFFKNHIIVTIIKAVIIQVLFIALFWIPIFAFVFIREQFVH